MTILIAIALVALSLYRFRARFNAEFYRQRMLSWPRVPASFEDKKTIALAPCSGSSSKQWFTRLQEPYRFYFNGALREGNRLIPNKLKLDEREQQEIGSRLNHQRDTLTVRYNPEDPTESLLFVPHQGLSWPRLLVYLFFGVVLPVIFIHFVLLPFVSWETASYVINVFN